MDKRAGLDKLKSLQQKWIGYQLVADALFSIAISVVLASMFWILEWTAWLFVPVFIIVFGLLAIIRRPWQITLSAICSFLNITYPQLEESSGLLLKPTTGLNLLEQLQLSKVEYAFADVPTLPQQFTKRFKTALMVAIAAIMVSFAISKIHYNWVAISNKLWNNQNGSSKGQVPEKILPQIASVSLKVTPPAYTGRPSREQDKFTIDAEEGSTVTWSIHTNIAVKDAQLLFNEKEKLKLTAAGSDKTNWTTSKIIDQPGFYQVVIDGKLSDLYQVQVIKDAAPIIRIKTPKQYTHIDAGEAPKVNLSVSLTDDYGLTDALIFATVAKGSGEGVKFKEYKLNFSTSFQQHNRQYDVQKLIDLPALNMEPGDELYFYVQAQDNHQQKSRTDVYIVSIQDTAQLLSMDGIIGASNLKPEFFRSERQIIIDTQQLLKDKDSITTDAFNKRCNDLGIDQKLLRLRYGKFLGEEDESGKEGNDELAKVENFSNAAMFQDAYTDKHDNAEDATFLEPAVKEQLKATLTEMWKAELQLRMFKPTDALPFEYKALRWLKDLQQKSRAYVAKTSYNPPPLKLEKRLTGDLSKIGQPLKQQDIKAREDKFINLKKAVTLLEDLKNGQNLTGTDWLILQLAEQQLSSQASAEPGIYLPAISALHRILSADKKVKVGDIAIAEKAIQKTLVQTNTMPSPGQTSADMGLAKGYYKNLNHLNR
ncbi:MAG: hypothetical protein ACXVAY_19885 [Mucilaginibacter sp.]